MKEDLAEATRLRLLVIELLYGLLTGQTEGGTARYRLRENGA